MEPGETPEEACRRETAEESSCLIQDVRFRHVYAVPSRSDVILTFRADVSIEQEWQANEEIAEKAFFSIDRLPKPMTRETVRKITDALDDEKGTQMMVLDHEDLTLL